MFSEKPKEINKPFLDNSTLTFLFMNLTKFYMKETKDVRYKPKFTSLVSTAASSVNKLYRAAFNQMPTTHKNALKEVGVYYFYAVALANQAENMEGMIKSMYEYLDKEQNPKKMNFREVWKFPLDRIGCKVYDSNKLEVFEFCGASNKKDEWKIDDESKDRLLNIINGIDDVKNNQILTFKDGVVSMELKGVVKNILEVKLSSNMILDSGLSLGEEGRIQIENEFCQFIVDSVNFPEK